MLLTIVVGAVAQVTTSSMAGKVTLEGSGEEIIGATVVAVHEPSGTRYTAVTNMNGMFTIQGMRPGGPYAVTVSYIGHQTKIVRNIQLQLAENYNLPVQLAENTNDLAEVVVTGKASKFSVEKTGAVTNINSEQILSMPTVSRDVTDITRLSPYGGKGMSFVGTDGRLGNFTVDGANFNNNFGLSSTPWRWQSYQHRVDRGAAGCHLAIRCAPDRLHRRWRQRHHKVGYQHLQGQRLHLPQE